MEQYMDVVISYINLKKNKLKKKFSYSNKGKKERKSCFGQKNSRKNDGSKLIYRCDVCPFLPQLYP